MAMTNVELYEALRGSTPDEAARMIAEAFHPARDHATRLDLADLRAATQADIADFRGEMHAEFASVRHEISDLGGEIKAVARLQQWMLGFFVPLWVGTFGTIIAVVLKG